MKRMTEKDFERNSRSRRSPSTSEVSHREQFFIGLLANALNIERNDPIGLSSRLIQSFFVDMFLIQRSIFIWVGLSTISDVAKVGRRKLFPLPPLPPKFVVKKKEVPADTVRLVFGLHIYKQRSHSLKVTSLFKIIQLDKVETLSIIKPKQMY